MAVGEGIVPPRTPDQGHTLLRCATCNLLRLHPQPTDTELAAAYSDTYAPHTRPGLSGKAKGWLERRSVRQLWRLLGPPRRVLDVGCATGDLLLSIRREGNANVTGVEPGQRAAEVARSRGLDVRVGMLEDAAFPDASFDTIILSHTLEHVRDPIATLLEIHRVLAPNGALILWLPNASSIEACVLGQRWIGYDPPRHLTTFSVATLTRALETTGFRVSQVRHEAVGLEWAWAFRSWLRDRAPKAERAIAPLHPILIVAATPLAAIGALTKRSGRIRVIGTMNKERLSS
ncbi:MAG TPA: class I SAM-dependent methyltransferase [Thermomicrobiales bacterium]|nr:class I SAM-dependent methyltransferase [Thermomicrobiales bacterium]